MGRDLFGGVISSMHVNILKNHTTDVASYIEKLSSFGIISVRF